MLRKVLSLAALVVFCSLSVLGWGGSAEAASKYPEKEIRIIIPYKAGGQSDLMARQLAHIIQKNKLLPQPIVVVPIPGAATVEALRTVQTSKPDGYTLVLHHSAFLAMKAFGQIPMSYKDFDMVCQLAEVPLVFVAGKSAPWKNAMEMLDDAKKSPKKLTIGIPGAGGLNHLVTLYFLKQTNTEALFKLVPFDGGSEALAAQLGGHIDLRMSTAGDAATYVKSGDIKPILSMDVKDPEGFPHSATLLDFNITKALVQRNGIFTTKNTPKEIRDLLSAAFKEAVETPEFKEFAKTQGCEPKYLNEQEYSGIFAEDSVIIDEIGTTVKKK
ncbi:MAG: tripartite tricarboxylate transporter substrate binding protein [Syntrophobacter sp.]